MVLKFRKHTLLTKQILPKTLYIYIMVFFALRTRACSVIMGCEYYERKAIAALKITNTTVDCNLENIHLQKRQSTDSVIAE
jgi:hypothetical protein